ncbi:hypothetical protein [Parafilimonas sp.]|uniref:hypothetical protein n=1 Tax=Parafilimonas sp. TaxID=1969739 RepID=UPI003F7F751B
MKLFRRRKEKKADSKPNAISKGMQAGYKRLQGCWAIWMMKRTENFSHRTWVVALILFVLSGSTYSTYLAVNAFTGKKSNAITITPIKKLKHATETGEVHIEAADLSEAEYTRIKRFRVYMDSLARSPSGKILYDSITNQRPGLMDSVRFIENYYQQLKQK